MMKKTAVVLMVLLAFLIVVPASFAQAGGAAEKPPINPTALIIAAGFGVAIAAFGGAFGQGRIGSSACEGIARNPGAAANIHAAMLLGIVFVETLTLFSFALGFLPYF